MTVDALFYRAPEPGQVRLFTRPQLASWDRAGTPSQERLASYLDVTKQAVEPLVEQIPGPLALRLDVGLPRSTALLDEHDLDNSCSRSRSPWIGRTDVSSRRGVTSATPPSHS